MITLALITALTLLALLAVLQVLVALGLPLGHFVWGGQHKVLPTHLRIGSVISIALYAGMAALLLSRSDVIGGASSSFVRIATWVLFGYFALGIAVNAISRSKPERLTMTPTITLLAIATLIIALAN